THLDAQVRVVGREVFRGNRDHGLHGGSVGLSLGLRSARAARRRVPDQSRRTDFVFGGGAHGAKSDEVIELLLTGTTENGTGTTDFVRRPGVGSPLSAVERVSEHDRLLGGSGLLLGQSEVVVSLLGLSGGRVALGGPA